MNTSPVANPADAFTVIPVVDYEPPTQDVSHPAPPCRPSSRPPLRRRSSHAPRAYTGQPSRSAAPERGTVMSPRMRQAAVFADAALRRVLEVIDRRRPATQLNGLLAPSLVDSVAAVARSAAAQAGGRRGAAVLRRMRLQPAGHRDPDSAAEVFGSFSRGNRSHAIACRVEQVDAAGATRWMVVALHIG
ncbi:MULTISPECIES: Rv3235 family protein [Mycobacterium]|uniref:Rv3235 family protein n=1 Tax=Mycobacterium TaxID=1763 RepID=UPI001F0CA361|nr:Rv3235 family protein [Mycobacterium colombiense]